MASTSSEILSSSNSAPAKWDVFLSYRGKDTRHIFTDHLYNALDRQGIRTFRDDPELRSGEVISDALFQAIEESKTYIVVFSKNYASSRWCLDELVEIHKCYETMKRSVIPVFYNIEPSVVRHQTGSFKKAFKKHETRSKIGCCTKASERHRSAATVEELEKWRDTLRKVSGISGMFTCGERSEAEIINKIVDRILQEIIPSTLHVPEYQVGLDSRVKGITSMLRSDLDGVIKIGIYGMRGVGKTTLAKSVFNENHLHFQGSCFLSDVREKDLASLQQQLINDVLKSKTEVVVHSIDQGTKLLRTRICSKKILVVLDDLDSYKQFESLVGPFASGSVVIITTTSEDILVNSDVKPEHRYMVHELNDAESLTLFTRHAFRDAEPDNSLMALSKDILCHAEGLPLALEIFGSLLYKKTEVGWRSFIEKLKRNPNTSIQQRLAISLDAVESDDPMLKKLFIDIACLFVGHTKKEAIEILETYYPYTDHKIDRLKESCLLTLNDNRLGMHGLLQDMGKDIARNDCPDEPDKHSRLWLKEDIYKVLENQKGTEVIECMIISTSSRAIPTSPSDLRAETFKRMTKLRFLYLNKVNLSGSFYQTFEDLRWLRWTYCPLDCLPLEFCPKKLVALLLNHSSMRILWDINKVAPVFEKLKTLDMAYSRSLTTTPDFTRLPCLETLNLKWCESLQEVHTSIECLSRLVFLDLCGCENLRSLPDSICNLRALEFLNVDHCSSLSALPLDLGNIESLKQLNAAELHITELPDSIGKFYKLIELSLGREYNIKKSHCPSQCTLEQWSSYKKLESLPETISGLRALEVLNIIDYKFLKALPMDLGNIESLKRISAVRLNISKLPNSIGCLGNLVELILRENKNLETLPDTICHLRGLKVLDVHNCISLQELPSDLGNIESLERLVVSGLNISKLPNSIGKLSKLIELVLCGSKNLKTLPDTISNLRSLEILDISSCENLEISPDKLWMLTRLTMLDACKATMDFSETALSLLTALPFGIGQLSRQTNISLTDWILKVHLIISKPSPNLKSAPSIQKQLKTLDLNCCENMIEIQGFEELPSLEKVDVKVCYSLHEDNLAKVFFKRYYKFGHTHGRCILRRSSQRSELLSSVSLDLPLDTRPNFMGLMMCFDIRLCEFFELKYSVKTATNFMDFRGWVYNNQGTFRVILPRSSFHFSDGDDKVELKANFKFSGTHLLYKKEITLVDE